MTREDIIRMAQQAEVPIRGHYDEQGLTPQELERFAALVAAAALAEDAMQRLTDVQQEMERKPLTNEDIAMLDWESFATKRDCVRAIERAHGIGGEE